MVNRGAARDRIERAREPGLRLKVLGESGEDLAAACHAGSSAKQHRGPFGSLGTRGWLPAGGRTKIGIALLGDLRYLVQSRKSVMKPSGKPAKHPRDRGARVASDRGVPEET